jgi:hypothetical protein
MTLRTEINPMPHIIPDIMSCIMANLIGVD